jgi:hypothetical protein
MVSDGLIAQEGSKEPPKHRPRTGLSLEHTPSAIFGLQLQPHDLSLLVLVQIVQLCWATFVPK